MPAESQTRYVILFDARMGSTHLTSLLRSHPQIRARGEVLGGVRRRGEGAAAQLQEARRALEAGKRFRAVGFKTKLRDVLFSLDALTALLEDRDARVVHMERHNIVKLAVSEFNAKRLARRGIDGGKLTDERERLSPAVIDPGELREIIEARAAAHQKLRRYVESLDLPVERIAYEELLTDEAGVLRRLFRYLEIESAPVRSEMLKNTPDDLREAVSNFGELREAFAGTEYEPMFDEVPVPARAASAQHP